MFSSGTFFTGSIKFLHLGGFEFNPPPDLLLQNKDPQNEVPVQKRSRISTAA